MKVAFVVDRIFDYRTMFYERLGEEAEIDLTVIHSGEPRQSPDSSYSERIVSRKTRFGLHWQTGVLGKLTDFDIVVFFFDIRYLSTVASIMTSSRCTCFGWGIGMGSSPIGKLLGNRFRVFLAKRLHRLAVYMPSNKSTVVAAGIPKEKVFVSPNTIHVKSPFVPDISNRKDIIFFGSLKKRKGIEDLIHAFADCIKQIPGDHNLLIVGGGDDQPYKQLAESLHLGNRVRFFGEVVDQTQLKTIFETALICISPRQIGLSVLQSFAFGTGFVTSKNSITGGEIENLSHLHNGEFYDGTVQQLSKIIEKLSQNVPLAHSYGVNANTYYMKNMMIDKLVSSFVAEFKQAKSRK